LPQKFMELAPVRAPSKITLGPDGKIRFGDFLLEPASKNWRRKRTWWRVRLDGKIISGWNLSPALAVAEAVRKSGAAGP
jgi:hypothetical protein